MRECLKPWQWTVQMQMSDGFALVRTRWHKLNLCKHMDAEALKERLDTGSKFDNSSWKLSSILIDGTNREDGIFTSCCLVTLLSNRKEENWNMETFFL